VITFGSVCSGIEAASVAWKPLGMSCEWLAEIEPFPSAVLAHHYPDVPNVGDMTIIADAIRIGLMSAPDMLVGGTPCQAFSVAGLRKGLIDPRGELTIKYVDIANAIDEQRPGYECIIVWENVPGVLSDKGNAFGCFLGALSGDDDALEPPGGKWTNAGVVFGPQRAIAWRILDAQYFGVAQRRRRVFLIASARKDFDPTEILFESEGVRRDIAPSRESREEITYDVAPCLVSSGIGVERIGETRGQDPVVAVQTFDRQSSGEYGTAPIAVTVSARDYKSATDLVMSVHGTQDPDINVEQAHTLGRNSGQENALVYGIPSNWIGREPKNGGNAVAPMIDVAPCQTKTDVHGVAYTTAFSAKDYGGDASVECERLQGFPDGYTKIPWRGKPSDECPDGNRYKALGNSMAVPCMAWIGQRIIQHLTPSPNRNIMTT
jgi:DNA (cytosine-5)-methyltransferase 1